MSGKVQRWHEGTVRRAVEILRGHEALIPALDEMSREFGFRVTRSGIDCALGRADLGTSCSHLQPSRSGRAKRVAAWEREMEPDEIPVTIDEGWDDKTDPGFTIGYAPDAAPLPDMPSHVCAPGSVPLPPHPFASPEEAASRGWAPEYDWNKPVPEGHRVKGNSTLYDATGAVDAQWVKSERDSDDPPAFDAVPEGHLVKKVSTLLDGQGKVRAQWVQAPKAEQEQWEQFWSACERNAKQYSGIAESTAAPSFADEETCTVYPLGDPHIGMLSWAKETGQDFDLHIAERDLTRAIDLLVDRSPASARSILGNVGDFFHAEGDEQLTPRGGNKLDCDTRHAKIVDVGFSTMRHLIDRLLTKHAHVDVVNVPGNHDPKTSRMLNKWLSAVYEREPRVTVVDNLNPYIYLTFGRNLIGFAHGDGAKPEQLPGIMAADRPEDWGATDYRIWVTGHIHHQVKKEFPGCVIESFRTLAGRDYWHSHKGYRSGQSLSCITLHKSYGEITRSTVDIKLVRAA